MKIIPITPQDATFNNPSCIEFETFFNRKISKYRQVFLRFFSIKTFQLLVIWMLKLRILRCNGYIRNFFASSLRGPLHALSRGTKQSSSVFHLLFLFTVLLFVLAGCSTATDPAEMYKGESGEQIFRKGEEALRKKDYSEAIKRFEALDAQYPFGRNAQVAQLHIIYAYYMKDEFLSAETAADRYIHTYPASPHVDYAYFMRGLSNYYQNLGILERAFSVNYATRDLTQIKKSYNDFAQLARGFPNSRYAPAARQYMIYLRNILANHQMHVAEYYYSRQAYVASANRANMLVRHYQGSPDMPAALVMMVKSYRHLHLDQNARDALRVLNYNYPNSQYVQDAIAPLNGKGFDLNLPEVVNYQLPRG